MVSTDADDLVAFEDVRVIRATAPALLCRVGGRSVWLPRAHISGKLWCTGDRGKLFIRRWVARDRHLIDVHGAAIASPVRSVPRLQPPGSLHLVRRDREPRLAH
jgi:hypothetical protein